MKAEFEPLTNHQVDEPSEIRWRRSSRMADSPCVLTTSEYGWSANMERNSMTSHMVSKNTMAVNPKHSGAEEEAGRCRQVGQDGEGPDLASLRHLPADLRLQMASTSTRPPSSLAASTARSSSA